MTRKRGKERKRANTHMQLETTQVCFVQTNVGASHAIPQPQGAKAGACFPEVFQGRVGEIDAVTDGDDFESRTARGELGQA